jgi:hypothetical protein
LRKTKRKKIHVFTHGADQLKTPQASTFPYAPEWKEMHRNLR